MNGGDHPSPHSIQCDLKQADGLFPMHARAKCRIAQFIIISHSTSENDMSLTPFGNHVKYAIKHLRSEEHTSELQSLMRISYAVFCLKQKNITNKNIIYPRTYDRYYIY